MNGKTKENMGLYIKNMIRGDLDENSQSKKSQMEENYIGILLGEAHTPSVNYG